MKRLISLLMITVFILSQWAMPVLAENKNVTVNAYNIYNDTWSTGYYDFAVNTSVTPNQRYGPYVKGVTVDGTDVRILHASGTNKDWATYDISASSTTNNHLPSGKYNLILNVGSAYDNSINIYIDGTKVIDNEAFSNTGGYTAYKTVKLTTQVYIPGDAKFLKVEAGSASMYLKSITFEYVETNDVTVSAYNIYNDTWATGYFDYAVNTSVTPNQRYGPYVNGVTVDGTDVRILHASGKDKDWAIYDISADSTTNNHVPTGKYNIILDVGSSGDNEVNIYIDGVKVVDAEAFSNTGGYNTRKMVRLTTQVIIPEGAKLLKVEAGKASMYLKSITFEYVETNDVTVSAYNIYNDTWATGYFDFAVNTSVTPNQRYGPYVNGVTVDGTDVRILHASGKDKDWAIYDISADSTTNNHVPSGIYNLILNVGSAYDNSINIYIDGDKVVDAEAFSNTGGYNTRKMVRLTTQVIIPKGAKLLKVEAGTASMYLNSVYFEYVGAVETKDVIISGKAVCDTENHGVGWYDTQYPNEAFTHSSISTATAKTLNWGDWAAYDISDVAIGTYELSVKSWYADTSFLVTVDGYSVLPVAAIKAATEAAPVTNTLGTIYFDGTQEIMKLRNVGVGATFVETITLKHISDDDTAEEYVITESVAFDSRNIIGDKGIGFGDNGLFGNTELDTEPNCLRLRGDEWAAYDVSSLEAGTYLLSTNRQQRLDITVTVSVDGIDAVSDKELAAKTNYSGYEYQEICVIKLSGSHKVLKLTNTSDNTSDFKDFTLTKVEEIYISDYADGAATIVAPIETEATIVFASYDGNGKLIDVKFDTKTITKGQAQYEPTVALNETGAAIVKVFVWGNMTSANPLCEELVAEINVVSQELYVLAGAKDGDGSIAAPFGSIEEAKEYL